MTKHSLKNISPDGITGMIFALEGIRNTIVLLNGPMGCKFYHSTTSQYLTPRPPMYLPLKEGEQPVEVTSNFLNDFFFRQPRVPCTWLDGHDYVYGTREKVQAALEYIRDHVDFDLLAVVNSPGASLIGDDPRELCRQIFPEKPTVVLESPGYSIGYYEGTEDAILGLLKQAGEVLWGKKDNKDNVAENMAGNEENKGLTVDTAGSKLTGSGKTPTVNLIGWSLWQKYAEGNRDEIIRLLELCGIQVNCVLCAGCTVEQIRHIPEADLNIVIYPEMGRRSALWMQENLNMPCYICDAPPLGFAATEHFLEAICRILGRDTSPVNEEIERARATAWYRINGVYSMCGLPNGTLFAVHSFPSEEKAYEEFFTDYLGMIRDRREIAETEAELVFSDANTIAELMVMGKRFCGIEIANPTMGYVDVIPKQTLGIRGALYLVEMVLNGFMNRII